MGMRYYLGYGNLLVAIVFFTIGILVLSKNWRSRVNIAFFYFLTMLADSYKTYWFWFRIICLPVTFVAVSSTHFIFEWIGIARKYKVF